MIRHTDHLRQLSIAHGIDPADILLIALNSCGLSNADCGSRRKRFEFAPVGHEDDPVYLIPSVGRSESPFHLEGGTMFLHDKPVGSVRNLDSDDIVMGYWRNGHASLTLNSNSRSLCAGCMFCYTRLDPASDPRISESEELEAYFSFLEDDLDWDDLRRVERITVCSGCFVREDRAVDHMRTVGEIARRHGFAGELHILSSVITSRAGLERIASELSPFHLTLTVECFENRFELLKRSKAELDFESMCRLLRDARELGIKTDFTYLVGLDPAEPALEKIELLLASTTTFPRFQIFQAHNAFQASYRAPGSDRIEFFLRFRRRLEEQFARSPLRPRSWENYRPLWYYSFAGQPYQSVRI